MKNRSLKCYEHLYNDQLGISFHRHVQRQHLASDDTFDQLRCPQNILIMVVLARKLKSDRNTIEQLRVI